MIQFPMKLLGLLLKKGYNLVKAWRIHLGTTQDQVATWVGITRAALSQMERTEQAKRTATLEKLVLSMGLDVEQLKD